MKKGLRKVFAAIMMLSLMLSSFIGTKAASAATDEFLVFIALGADSTAEGASWDVQYYGPKASGNTANVEAVTATVKNGETATVSLTVPEIKYTWFMAPCVIVGDMAVDASSTFDYTCSIDGVDVTDTIKKDAGKAFWNEGTGDYKEAQCVRVGGGYNEWGDKYMETSPAGFTKIEYTITLNVVEGTAAGNTAVESTSEYDAFIAIGADSKAEGASWDVQYYGEKASSNAGDVTAVNGKLKNGETTTISLTVPEIKYTWFMAPCINTNGDIFAEGTTFDVKVAINGVDVTDTIDFSAGKAFWNEGTGELKETTCVRVAGGYNEWGDKYIKESPKDFTEISYTITPHILIGSPEDDGKDLPAVDLDGEYNAYIGIQTPVYQFRNAYDDKEYGAATDYFNQLTGWDADSNAVKMPGTFTDAKIAGNGTYKVSVSGFDFTNDFNDKSEFNLLFVSTDMPVNDSIKITNVNVIMDGKTVYTFDEGFQDAESDWVKLLAVNTYNSEMPKFSYKVPGNDIAIEFTVSGFNYDAAVAEPTPEPTATPEPTKEPTKAPTQTPTKAPTPVAETTAPADNGGTNVGLIVGIVIAVLAVAAIVVVIVMKKKKTN